MTVSSCYPLMPADLGVHSQLLHGERVCYQLYIRGCLTILPHSVNKSDILQLYPVTR